MKKTLKYMVAAALMLSAGNTMAQNLSSAYFLDGYAYGHELNPAKDYDRSGYFSLPFLPGNLNIGMGGNFGLKDFIYKNPNGNGLVTYLHPSIDANFKNNNKFLQDMRYDILSFGFHTKHSYQTFTLGLRDHAGINIPGDMLNMVKNLENKTYNFNNLGANAQAWIEAGWSYSREVGKAFRVGGKLKLLLGGAYANMKMDNLSLDLSGTDKWTASANATMEVGLKGMTWGETETKEYKNQYPGHTTYQQLNLDNADVDGAGLNGFGLGFDLGAEWDLQKQELVDGLKLSASLLDLGFIKWNNVAIAQNKGDQFVFDGFNNIKVEDGNGEKFEDQTDKLADRLSDLYSLQDGGTTSKATGLGATLNIGAEYTLQSYKGLKFGFLSTTRIQGVYSWNEERFSANLSPCKWFDVVGNFAVGTRGANLGWMINIHPRGFNLFVGSDHCIGKLSKQFIPLRSNYDLCMGINFPLGKSRK